MINWIDVLVLIILVRTSYVGWYRGLAYEIFRLAGIVVTFLVALSFYDDLGHLVSQYSPIPTSAAYLICFLLLLLVITLILRITYRVLEKVGKLVFHPAVDRYGGFVFGICRGMVAAGLLVAALSILPFGYIQESIETNSLLSKHLRKITRAVSRMFPRIEVQLPGSGE